MHETRSREEYSARIEQVVAYISVHLGEDLDLERLACLSHFSPYHFHRIFNAEMGETPQDLVNRFRLEHAANLLLKSNLSVTEIALSCGFSSSATFARSFKKYFGLPASAYARRGFAVLPNRSGDQVNAADFHEPEVRMEWMPSFHLVHIANLKGYSLPVICRAWERLFRWAGAHELIKSETRIIGISFDDPSITRPEKCRYYACLTVPENVAADGMVGTLDIPASRCAVCRALVLPEQIELIYRFFYRAWLPDSGLQPADFPAYEIYYETPETNAQGRFLMDVCVPVLPL